MSRYICTKTDPWTPEKGPTATHPDAREVGDGDEVARYFCPNCEISWKQELPG